MKKTIVAAVLAFSIIFTLGFSLGGCASMGAISAEEYFAIGMAYFDLGRYDEAEQWLNRARARDRTMSASEYNLGRIAFETGRFDEALRYFELILRRDPTNVMALRAAAYTQIRNGEIEKAAALYDRLLAIVPESADDGYNHALVLYAMERYADAERVLANYEFALLENNDVLLLFARIQRELGKPEAIDSFAQWLVNNNDPRVRYEYAQVLESHEFYARALDEYREALTDLPTGSVDPTGPELRFTIARLLLVADSESSEGISELRAAVEDGYDDSEAIEDLLDDDRISATNKDEIRTIITNMTREDEPETEDSDAPIEETEDAQDIFTE